MKGSRIALTLSLAIMLSWPVIIPKMVGSSPSNGAPAGSFTPFMGSIIIDSEDDFTADNGVVSGSGTTGDPYIIEGWSLDASSGIALKIANTRSHVIVRDIAITGGTGSGSYSAVIDHARNVTIASSAINWTGGGIHLIGPCVNITIERNRIENNTGSGIIMMGKFEDMRIHKNALILNHIDGINANNPNGKGIVISNNSLIANYAFGIEIISGSCLNLTDNRIIRNGNGGIHAAGTSPGVEIRSNVIEDHEFYGMEIQGVTEIFVSKNRIEGSDNIGIYLGSGSRRCLVRGNILSENNEGIVLGDVDNITVQDNNIDRSKDGIAVYGVWNSIISNSISNCRSNGLFLFQSYKNDILSNTISDSTCGILIVECKNENVQNNTFSGSVATSIRPYFCEDITIKDNDLSSEGLTLSIEETRGTTILSNWFRSNFSCMEFISCSDVLIYDNWFHDSHWILGSENPSWSLPERTPGNNIIGGRFLFGNFWANYDGEDIDGDGIGDTLIPFGPGDIGPLVKDPPSPDITAPDVRLVNAIDIPEMGKDHTFVFNVTDDRRLFKTNVTLDWYQANHKGNIEDSGRRETAQINESGFFMIDESIVIDSEWINFTSYATDLAGNARWQCFNVSVRDTILPAILSYSSDDEARTGENFSIVIHSMDNIEVQRVYSRYCFESEPDGFYEAEGTRSMQWMDGYDIAIPIDPNAIELDYELVIVDGSNNSISSGMINIPVTDTIPPSVKDLSIGSPRTGEDFALTFLLEDNIAVATASLHVSFDGGHDRNYDAPDPADRIWTCTIGIGEGYGVLDYWIVVKDGAGHEFLLEGRHDIKDITPPTIEFISNGTPQTGKEYELIFDTDDNIDLKDGYVEWWFDPENHIIDKNIPTTFKVRIPEEAYVLNVVGFVSDLSGNDASCKAVMNVTDGTPPTVIIRVGRAVTSSLLNISVMAWDNRGLQRTWVQYSINGIISVTEKSELSVNVPENATSIVIVALSQDISGLVSSLTQELDVSDGTPPKILSHSVERIEGGKVRFTMEATDNRLVSRALLYLDSQDPLYMQKEGGVFTLVLEKDEVRTGDSYYFEVSDEAGNSVISNVEWLDSGRSFPWGIMAIITLIVIAAALVGAIIAIRWRRTTSREE